MKPKRNHLQWWLLPTLLYILHGLAVIGFATVMPPMTGQGMTESSMGWLLWVFIDFPIGFLSMWIGSGATSNTLGVAAIALIGGIQWIIWGLAATGIIRLIQRRRADRSENHPNNS